MKKKIKKWSGGLGDTPKNYKKSSNPVRRFFVKCVFGATNTMLAKRFCDCEKIGQKLKF